jgi:hypothetical protein
MVPLACAGFFGGWFVTASWFAAVNFIIVTVVDHAYIPDFDQHFIVLTLRHYVSATIGLAIMAFVYWFFWETRYFWYIIACAFDDSAGSC